MYLPQNEMAAKVADLKARGKRVVLSLGVYDLIHPGIVDHLSSAKTQGDVLVVGIIRDEHARFGPGRPVFPQELRIKNVMALLPVDYITVVDNATPFEAVRALKPTVFAKGKPDQEQDLLVYGKGIVDDHREYFGDAVVFETEGYSFSASTIINKLLDLYPQETKDYLKDFSRKYSFAEIARMVHGLSDMKVLLIGDGIIDDYQFCESMSRSAKTPLIVNRYLYHEQYAGGAFAIANHLSSIVKEVHLISLLGSERSYESFVLGHLRDNVTSRFFYRADGPTVVKKRYINETLGWKLFEVNYINNHYISDDECAAVTAYISEVISGYDLVLVSDFGHGFITERMMRTVEERARMLAINTQTNAANSGFNMITKYRKSNFVCLDESEVRLASQERFTPIESVAPRIRADVNADCLVATLGRHGSLGVNAKGESASAPIFSTKVVDTIGAGDAYFSYTAPCVAKGYPLDFVTFIGNAVGALAVQIVGNKLPVEKMELLRFVNTILK